MGGFVRSLEKENKTGIVGEDCIVFLQFLWETPIWAFGLPMDCVCFAQHLWSGMCQGRHGPHGEFFFFLIQKEPATMPARPLAFFSRPTSAFFSLFVDVIKKCALIGMHQKAEEGRGGESGCHTLDLGDMWRFVWPKSPRWESEDEVWSEDESILSGVSRENNVCNGALHVTGFCGFGDKISLPKVALSAKKCMRLGSWVDGARGASVSQQDKPVSRDVKERERQAFSSEDSVSESFVFYYREKIGCVFRNVGFPSFRQCCVGFSRFERGFATFQEQMATVEKRFS